MNQGLSAQVLTRKPHPFPLHFVEREGVRQASGAKKILFQNETDLKHISLTQPLERDHYQGLKIILQNETDLQQIFYVKKKSK